MASWIFVLCITNQ